MEDGFTNYAVRQLVCAGECLGHTEIISGEKATVELLAATDFSFALAKGEQPELILPVPGFVYAPVVRGQEAGFAYVCLEGNPVGKIPLIYGETVEKESVKKPSLWDGYKKSLRPGV